MGVKIIICVDIGVKNHINLREFLDTLKVSLIDTFRFVLNKAAITPTIVSTNGFSFDEKFKNGSFIGCKRIQLNIEPPIIAPVVRVEAGTNLSGFSSFIL